MNTILAERLFVYITQNLIGGHVSGSARAGAIIYAINLDLVSAFYEKLLPMSIIHKGQEIIVLESADFQLVIHAIPQHIASTIIMQSPPERREETAIKLFFTVENLSLARANAVSLGGEVFEQEWAGPGFQACNGSDPEGNIFQLREGTH